MGFFWPVMTGSANVGFELKCARDFMDHIFITSEHREGEQASVYRQQRLFRCTSGVLKWDLMSFVQQHEDNGVRGSTRQWLVQFWLYADFVKRPDYKKVMSKPLLHFYWSLQSAWLLHGLRMPLCQFVARIAQHVPACILARFSCLPVNWPWPFLTCLCHCSTVNWPAFWDSMFP